MKSISSVMAIILLTCTTTDAMASPSCMTRQEARAAFPRAHLYWAGEQRCWSDKAGRSQARRYRREPVSNDDVEMPKPLPAPPKIMVPEPPQQNTTATQSAQFFNDAWVKQMDEQRAAMEQFAAKLALSSQARAMESEEEPLQTEPVKAEVPAILWVRWAGALVAFIGIAVIGGLASRRWLPNLMEGS
jgi:hypothetical protein